MAFCLQPVSFLITKYKLSSEHASVFQVLKQNGLVQWTFARSVCSMVHFCPWIVISDDLLKRWNSSQWPSVIMPLRSAVFFFIYFWALDWWVFLLKAKLRHQSQQKY